MSITHANRKIRRATSFVWLVLCLCTFLPRYSAAQVDQGAITGVVRDSDGAVIPGAQVTITDIDTGLVLQRQTDGSGIYVFSPVKIGNYRVSAVAPGFQTTVQEHLHLDMQERVNVALTLKPGAISQSIVVSTAPGLLQTQSSSVGQVMSAETINDVPLNQRNWVYIAQLAAGVDPAVNGASRGGGTGDFFANGQRATQNDFILNGVDNNVNVDDFMNGASYNVSPPPDALAEFRLDTADFSAEFGHSAGAVLNASIKSGTNQIHGDIWEYVRNTSLDAKDWDALTIPAFHENQFGATLGLPILKNKLFYFGDAQANRVTYGNTLTLNVPTALMRQGNFSELLNPSLTGQAQPIRLFQPNTVVNGAAAPVACNGQANVLCANQIDAVAQRLFNLFPMPNAGNGATYNNLKETLNQVNNTWQFDQRLDWNIGPRDQAYATFSYSHQLGFNPPPLGPILDGSKGYNVFQGQNDSNLSEAGMVSETHVFNSKLTNEFRFGYNWGAFSFLQAGANDPSAIAELGVGGIPAGPNNGGLPEISIKNLTTLGTDYLPSEERQNVYQILDNVTIIVGNHSMKAGINLQNIRPYILQPYDSRGQYEYTSLYTSNLGASFTGYAPASFLENQLQDAFLSSDNGASFYRWYRAGYFQDDWRIKSNLTLNLGLRYDYYQPPTTPDGHIANLQVLPPFGQIGTGQGVLQFPRAIQNIQLPASYLTLLAQSNVTVQYVNSNSLTTAQKTNFAPRIGFAYQPDPKTVISSGFGIFYGGLESLGGEDLGFNYPFIFQAGLRAPNCLLANCPSLNATNGVTLENGFTNQLTSGLENFISLPSYTTMDPHVKTPYTMNYNLMFQRELMKDVVASISYVGNVSRHLVTPLLPNASDALQNPSNNSQNTSPFPLLNNGSGFILDTFVGISNYNALQTKLQKRYSNGLNFLATYTWAHAMDDSSNPGGIQSGVSTRNNNLIPISDEYTTSAFDVRHRFTFNAFYELPFGKGRAYLNKAGWTDLVAGGWGANLTFTAQTGMPFAVSPNTSVASGDNSANAILKRDPFAAGGTADPSNVGTTCAAHTRNKTNWFNPCAFANPLPGTDIPISGPGSEVTGLNNAIAYLGGTSNQIHGPGYERVKMSLFKNFDTWREQYLQFRADAFNLLNHPSLGSPSGSDNSSGGQITSPQSFQTFTPDARFFQLSLKYVF